MHGTPFPALPQTRMLDLKPAVDAKALVTVGPGWPFVIARDHGAGRVILVNASADRAWGDFPLSPAFLPLVQQIARLSGARGETARALTVGEAITGAPNLPRNEPLNLAWPDGSAHDIAAGAQPALLEHAEESGFYEARGGRESALYAVNVDRRESDLKPIDPAALDRIVPHETVAGLENLKFRLAQGRGLVPLWPGLLLLALAAYAAEAVLANTMAGKRSQGETAHIATGRLNKRRAGTPFRAGIAGGGA